MTTYIIKKSDSTELVELVEGQIDTVSSSLTLLGKNVYNFGEAQNTNLLHLLENFASTSSPMSPTVGQLWFDTRSGTLKVYDNARTWASLPSMLVTPAPDANSKAGAMLFDTTTNQLYVNTGTAYTLIGPDATPGYGSTRLISDIMLGTEVPTPLTHPVIKCMVGDQVIAVISSNTFNINNANPIPYFSTIYKGITMSTNSTQVFGIADKSKLLLNQAGNSYIGASTATVVNSIVQRDGLGNTSLNDLIVRNVTASNSISVQGQVSASSIATTHIYGSSGALHGDWSSAGSIFPASNTGSNLGAPSLRWGIMYSQLADITQLSASSLNFVSLIDASSRSITQFDTDTALSSNSDSKLVTQKAVKTYVDSAILALQNQLNSLETIPPGTVMFTAGTSVPNGFLAANGASIPKSVYGRLFTAIGGTYGQTSTTFNLPDLRGQFVRGWDAGKGVDAGRALGTLQSDEIKSHSHVANGSNFVIWPNPGGHNGLVEQNQKGGPEDYAGLFTNTANTGGGETRPKNIALMGIIKY